MLWKVYGNTKTKISVNGTMILDGDYNVLNGATFDLLDEDKKVIKTGVTANGGVLDFGTIYTPGDQRTRYYIRETYTPEGYKNHLKYLIRLDVSLQEDDATKHLS